jgi:hypothetical protein
LFVLSGIGVFSFDGVEQRRSHRLRVWRGKYANIVIFTDYHQTNTCRP